MDTKTPRSRPSVRATAAALGCALLAALLAVVRRRATRTTEQPYRIPEHTGPGPVPVPGAEPAHMEHARTEAGHVEPGRPEAEPGAEAQPAPATPPEPPAPAPATPPEPPADPEAPHHRA
ncbi:hypothetical protein [Streptomyces sp. TRM64462]|uniref:hypothetical protein n=1 Tax=Streptomyces sp. TRM64462 TaxID=2741726 RepID=UPI00158682E5|nr:hypothetical protein [Streptomyces sp. TRM64462]